MDKDSLYSCLLVNKEWCNIVVLILWKKISWYRYSNKSIEKIVNTILSCLSSSSKRLLSENGIELPSLILLRTPLFNYISFIKFPRASDINRCIRMVFKEEFDPINLKQNLLEHKLFVSQCKNIKELWWETSQPLPLFPGASTCFSQLCYLCINIDFINSSALHEMAQICKDLNRLAIYNCHQDVPGLITLIDAQRNLKSVNIYADHNKKGTCKELGKALARERDTINQLILNPISIIPQPSFLTSLIKLKTITHFNYKDYDSREEVEQLQQYLAASEFPDLECLDVENLSYCKEFAMIIEKTSENISKIYIDHFNKLMAIKIQEC